MNSKTHNLLRTLQWLIPAIVTLYGVVDSVAGWNLIGPIEKVASAVVAFIGVLAQHSSKVYFDTRDIVDKVVPDKEDA